MWEETAIKNGQISDFQGLMALTFDRVILHTVMHHSSTSTVPTYQISLKLKKRFVDGRIDIEDPLMLLCRLGGVDLVIITPRSQDNV